MTQDRQQQLVRLAFELQAKDAEGEQRKAYSDALRDGALETGLEPRYLKQAEEELARREQERSLRIRRRSRFAVAALASALVMGGLGYGVSRLFGPSAPWVETFDNASGWGLETGPDARAELTWQEESGRGRVAAIHLASGSSVTLQGALASPRLSAGGDLVMDLKGTVPNARVYLEAGPERRWVSPPIAVQQSWTTHRIPLRSFEHQSLLGRNWENVSWSVPEGVTQISVRLEGSPGDVWVDKLGFEKR